MQKGPKTVTFDANGEHIPENMTFPSLYSDAQNWIEQVSHEAVKRRIMMSIEAVATVWNRKEKLLYKTASEAAVNNNSATSCTDIESTVLGPRDAADCNSKVPENTLKNYQVHHNRNLQNVWVTI